MMAPTAPRQTASFDLHCQTTAEIVYRMPDHPAVLQSFIWQHLDMAPDFPRLKRFLEYWEENLDGAIHSVRVVRTQLIRPRRLIHTSHLAWLH